MTAASPLFAFHRHLKNLTMSEASPDTKTDAYDDVSSVKPDRTAEAVILKCIDPPLMMQLLFVWPVLPHFRIVGFFGLAPKLMKSPGPTSKVVSEQTTYSEEGSILMAFDNSLQSEKQAPGGLGVGVSGSSGAFAARHEVAVKSSQKPVQGSKVPMQTPSMKISAQVLPPSGEIAVWPTTSPTPKLSLLDPKLEPSSMNTVPCAIFRSLSTKQEFWRETKALNKFRMVVPMALLPRNCVSKKFALPARLVTTPDVTSLSLKRQ
mmetsp:Transcript_20607/g.48709  ORF Transcript_20607/g.48709 Transcript_20607/m.48709 type:complete len:263 (-) Transcript_20607:2659-3447(-)